MKTVFFVEPPLCLLMDEQTFDFSDRINGSDPAVYIINTLPGLANPIRMPSHFACTTYKRTAHGTKV